MYLGVLAGGGGSFTFSRPTLDLGRRESATFPRGVPRPAPRRARCGAPPPAPDPPGPHRSDINIPLRFSKVYFTSKL